MSKTVCSDTVAAAAQEVHLDALEGGMGKNENRCWPGYEPVEAKRQDEQGSCRPKAKGKLTAGEKEFRSERAGQLAKWKKAHPGSPIQAAQHLHKPEKAKTVKKSAKKKVAKKHTAVAAKR